jgi:hypothetical protein
MMKAGEKITITLGVMVPLLFSHPPGGRKEKKVSGK